MLNCLIYRGIEEFSWLIPHSFSVAKHFTYKVFMSPPPGDEYSCACRHFPRIEFILVMKQNTFRMVLAFQCDFDNCEDSNNNFFDNFWRIYLAKGVFLCSQSLALVPIKPALLSHLRRRIELCLQAFFQDRVNFSQNNCKSKEFQKFAPPPTSWFYVFCLYTQLMWHVHCAWYTVHLTNQTL